MTVPTPTPDTPAPLSAGEREEELARLSSGELHIWQGACPDRIEGYDTRDPECPGCSLVDRILALLVERDALAEQVERDAVVRETVAEMIRDHTMPPNKDRHGYDYRMGWWDAVTHLDTLVKRRLRAALDVSPEPDAPKS